MDNIKITKDFVNEFYNKSTDGIKVFKNAIPKDNLIEINSFISKQKDTFEVKREKYIDNNQLVSLLYRGDFDLSGLDDTIFASFLNEYKSIRSKIEELSDIPFQSGSSLEVKLIHYPISDLGVGIHKDLSSNVNLIVFFNIEGSTTFRTYSDKIGTTSISHPLNSGDISIMRGQRFNEEDNRPYHGIEKVVEERTVLVIREIDEILEKEVNKDNWRGF